MPGSGIGRLRPGPPAGSRSFLRRFSAVSGRLPSVPGRSHSGVEAQPASGLGRPFDDQLCLTREPACVTFQQGASRFHYDRSGRSRRAAHRGGGCRPGLRGSKPGAPAAPARTHMVTMTAHPAARGADDISPCATVAGETCGPTQPTLHCSIAGNPPGAMPDHTILATVTVACDDDAAQIDLTETLLQGHAPFHQVSHVSRRPTGRGWISRSDASRARTATPR